MRAHHSCCKLAWPGGNHFVINPYELLRQKQSDAARVRKEVEALRIVIPLLNEECLSLEELQASFNQVGPAVPLPTSDGIADLKLYFPFVKNLNLDQPPETTPQS